MGVTCRKRKLEQIESKLLKLNLCKSFVCYLLPLSLTLEIQLEPSSSEISLLVHPENVYRAAADWHTFPHGLISQFPHSLLSQSQPVCLQLTKLTETRSHLWHSAACGSVHLYSKGRGIR